MLSVYFLLFAFAVGVAPKPAHDALQANHLSISESRTYNLSGTMKYTTSFQGGAARSVEFPDPVPLANYTLKVIRIDKEGTKPRVVAKVTSDEKGNFSVNLSPSIYGFAGVDDSLIVGQYLPHATQHGGIAEYHTSRWEISTWGSIDMRYMAVQGIVLTRHDQTICGICP